jgi:hypothetical protein
MVRAQAAFALPLLIVALLCTLSGMVCSIVGSQLMLQVLQGLQTVS